MNLNILNDLVALCAKKGIRNAVLCPGSRSAPLTLAFARNKNITCRTFSDERSAAFIALGMAQQSKTPTALVCTSGSAAYNFAPAIAEAFFQGIPLIVFTADRPTEWIDQLDGQTIRQKELYGNHVVKYFELPLDYSHTDAQWHTNRILNEAINLCLQQKGPVHINAPFREPLYPAANEKVDVNEPRIIESVKGDSILPNYEWSTIIQDLGGFKKILIVAGQGENEASFSATLGDFINSTSWALTGDMLSNLHAVPSFCGHSDTYLGQASTELKQSLQADLIITFGKSLVSKSLKHFLRQFKPKAHWHLQSSGETADTFQSLTRILPITPDYFFSQLTSSLTVQKAWKDYQQAWTLIEANTKAKIKTFFETKRNGEFDFVNQLLESLPASCNLHLSNSMTVRYANHIGLSERQKSINVFCNRGTSGIDGCSSTAVGHALTSDIPNILITGDLAFFYDRNAFWHNYTLPNLFIIVLNNHGGIIFNLIDGPSGLPEAKEFFITEQKLNAKSLAAEFGYSYDDALIDNLKDFFKSNGKVRILEFDSPQEINKQVFEEFKKRIK